MPLGVQLEEVKVQKFVFIVFLVRKTKDIARFGLSAIRRDKWTDSEIANARLCSKNFISDRLIYSVHFQSRIANGHFCTFI